MKLQLSHRRLIQTIAEEILTANGGNPSGGTPSETVSVPYPVYAARSDLPTNAPVDSIAFIKSEDVFVTKNAGGWEDTGIKWTDITSEFATKSELSGKADTSHTHKEYAIVSHTHKEYALSSHTHTGYAPESHTHEEFYDKETSDTIYPRKGNVYTKKEVDDKFDTIPTGIVTPYDDTEIKLDIDRLENRVDELETKAPVTGPSGEGTEAIRLYTSKLSFPRPIEERGKFFFSYTEKKLFVTDFLSADLVPKMNGLTMKGSDGYTYVVSASSSYDANTAPWYLFSDVLSSGYTQGWTSTLYQKQNQYVQVDLGRLADIASISITPWNNPEGAKRSPSDFDIMASEDGVNFTVISSLLKTDWAKGQKETFAIPETKARFIKLFMRSNNGDTSHLAIGQVEILGGSLEYIQI